MKHERDLNLNHTLLLWILRRKYWDRSFLYYFWYCACWETQKAAFWKARRSCLSEACWACHAGAWVRFHLLIIFSTRRVLFCIFADSLSPRRASEISSTLHRLLCVSLLRIVAQVVATKTREWDSIYVSSALLPACTQYSRPELATQGITVVALVTDFEVTCAYPMPDEWRNLIANQHN